MADTDVSSDKPALGLEHFTTRSAVITHTAGAIITEYLRHNTLSPRDALELLPQLARTITDGLWALDGGDAPEPASEPAAEVEKPTPAQIRKSVTPDAIISFLDGKPYKTLRRHLTTHGLTPEGYRARYGLAPDYPMTAPSYSAARSELAKAAGLGRGGAPTEQPAKGLDPRPADDSLAA